MNQSNSSKQVLLSVIGVAILVVAVVGVSFAFFNYTRTGSANTLTTGTIQFNSTNTLMAVDNLFPVSAATAQAVNSNTDNVAGYATVTITGSTTYTPGIDYEVTATNVNLTASDTVLPISVYVTEDSNLTGIGTHSVTSYNVTNTTLLDEGDVLAAGHINGTGDSVNHVITIRAYVDAAKVAISDTLAEGVSDNNGGTAGRITVENYTNGTTSTWVDGRRVLTTAQWNALNSSSASFTIRVEANETASS